MKRPVSLQELFKAQSELTYRQLSPYDLIPESFDPYDPSHQLKPLRSAPRKISHMAETELDQFDAWLKSEDTAAEDKAGFSNQEKKSRPDKVISMQDQEMFENKIPTYRKISFTPIPAEFKPQYERNETFMACSSIADLLILRKKYMQYDQYILQHPLLYLESPEEPTKVITELKENLNWGFDSTKGLIINNLVAQNLKIEFFFIVDCWLICI